MAARHNRAAQFTPFAALRGFEMLIAEKETVRVERHVFAEDGAELLSRKMAQVQKGMLLSVIHYKNGAYISTTGMVSSIDPIGRILTIVKLPIAFDDIYTISGEDISEG